MEIIKPRVKDYPGRHIELNSDQADLDFEAAKDLARQKAKELCEDPMLLSWYQGKTGESYPNMECGPGDKPAWIIFAESRGGDLTIDVNGGQYVFIYLSSW
ncbi:MAG: AF1514 family protein [Desulfobacterales bacterium]